MKHTAQLVHKGFTLIELLIVIAVLGVLAAIVLVTVNPIEQLARGRDSGRKTTVGQLGKAVQAYYTTHSTSAAPLPAANATWITTLQTAGEVKQIPPSSTYSVTGTAPCGTNTQPVVAGSTGGYCYAFAGTEFIVFARLESDSEDSKCAVAANNAYFLYSSQDGRGGTVCSGGDPAAMNGYTYF